VKPALLALVLAASGLWVLASPGGTETRQRPLVPAQRPELRDDSVEAARRVDRVLRNHYGTGAGRLPGRIAAGGSLDRYCSGGEGALCHGGDPDRGPCPVNVPCHRTEEFLLNGLLQVVEEFPASVYARGQAVYALAKFGHMARAGELANACAGDPWWCGVFRGSVAHGMGLDLEAFGHFREAWAHVPRAERCRFGDASWLLGEWDQRSAGVASLPDARRAAANLDCELRLAVSDTLFWLADPLFSQEGNDRWTEHMARASAGHFAGQIRRAQWGADLPQRYQDRDWAMRIRRGVWDSYERLPGGRSQELRIWTSGESARYRFVPNVGLEGLSNPTWRLEGNILTEGFTPLSGRFVELPVQVARFRRQDSLRVAAAAGLMESPLQRVLEGSAHLIFSNGPGSFLPHRTQEVGRENPVFLVTVAQGAYVLGMEVETRLGFGWHRVFLASLAREGPELSDLLLFDAMASPDPAADSLSAVSPRMLPSSKVRTGSSLGVFWETYGAERGTLLDMDLALERSRGGFVDRLVGLLPLNAQERQGRVSWTEEAAGEIHPRGIALDLTGVEEGEYALVLRVSWAGRPVLERRHGLIVE
jgi:hypothetical protein